MKAQRTSKVKFRPAMFVLKNTPTFGGKCRQAIVNIGSHLPHGILSGLGFGTDTITVSAALNGAEPEPSIERLLGLGILWPAEVDRVCADQTRTRFLIEDLLPVKSIAIAAGDSTIGKSALVCQLGLSVASGQPFLGMPTEQGRVLYLDLENSLYDCQTMRDSLLRHLGVRGAPQAFLLAQDASSDLQRLLEIARPKLVIIDSLRSFRPDVTERNSKAGEWLKEIRGLTRQHNCAFLVVHHLRKPSENAPGRLADSTVATWFQEMEGPRGFFNQTDVRIAIEEVDGRSQTSAALEMKWARRVRGDSPIVQVERVFDEDGEPLGYRHLTGVGVLDQQKQAVFQRLPEEFTTAEAKALRRDHHLGDGNDPTNKFLAECKQLRIVEKLGRGRWRKTAA